MLPISQLANGMHAAKCARQATPSVRGGIHLFVWVIPFPGRAARLDRVSTGLPGRGRSDRRHRWGSLRADTRSRRCGAKSEEHTSELQSLMRISYAVFCLKKKKKNYTLT